MFTSVAADAALEVESPRASAHFAHIRKQLLNTLIDTMHHTGLRYFSPGALRGSISNKNVQRGSRGKKFPPETAEDRQWFNHHC